MLLLLPPDYFCIWFSFRRWSFYFFANCLEKAKKALNIWFWKNDTNRRIYFFTRLYSIFLISSYLTLNLFRQVSFPSPLFNSFKCSAILSLAPNRQSYSFSYLFLLYSPNLFVRGLLVCSQATISIILFLCWRFPSS